MLIAINTMEGKLKWLIMCNCENCQDKKINLMVSLSLLLGFIKKFAYSLLRCIKAAFNSIKMYKYTCLHKINPTKIIPRFSLHNLYTIFCILNDVNKHSCGLCLRETEEDCFASCNYSWMVFLYVEIYSSDKLTTIWTNLINMHT